MKDKIIQILENNKNWNYESPFAMEMLAEEIEEACMISKFSKTDLFKKFYIPKTLKGKIKFIGDGSDHVRLKEYGYILKENEEVINI